MGGVTSAILLRHPVDRIASLYWYEHVGWWHSIVKVRVVHTHTRTHTHTHTYNTHTHTHIHTRLSGCRFFKGQVYC